MFPAVTHVGHPCEIAQQTEHRKLMLTSSPTCGQEDQPTEHVLHAHKATREDVWPVSTLLTTRFYGCKQELQQTTLFISQVALIV